MRNKCVSVGVFLFGGIQCPYFGLITSDNIAHLLDSQVCKLNLKLYHTPLQGNDLEAMLALDAAQSKLGKANTKKGDDRRYSSKLVRQAYGPLQKIILPIGHSRRSYWPLMRVFVKCETAARCIDYGRLWDHLDASRDAGDSADDDEIPLDVLGRLPS